jgi:hypothetical protein
MPGGTGAGRYSRPRGTSRKYRPRHCIIQADRRETAFHRERKRNGDAFDSSAEVVRDASAAVDHAVANLRLEVEDFLAKVAV